MKSESIDVFFETSAKDNLNVTEAFNETGRQLFLSYIQNRSSVTSLTGDKEGVSIK